MRCMPASRLAHSGVSISVELLQRVAHVTSFRNIPGQEAVCVSHRRSWEGGRGVDCCA